MNLSIITTKMEYTVKGDHNDLTGIDFPDNVKTLYCTYNKLTSLEGCPNSVKTLYCYSNPLLPEWKNLSLNEIKTKNSVITINKLTFRSHIWKLYKCGFNKQILSFFVIKC